jgi:hypothetical protein
LVLRRRCLAICRGLGGCCFFSVWWLRVVGVFDGVGAVGVVFGLVVVGLFSAEGEDELEAADLVFPRSGVLWGGALL